MICIRTRPVLAFVALTLSLCVAQPALSATSILDDKEEAADAKEEEKEPAKRRAFPKKMKELDGFAEVNPA